VNHPRKFFVLVVFAFLSIACSSLRAAKESLSEAEEGMACTIYEPLADLDQDRIAFVVGNGAYQPPLNPLRNPVNDATEMAFRFRELGFQTYLATDVTSSGLWKCLDSAILLASDSPPHLAAFYFSGHGLQIQDHNYLAGVNTSLIAEDDDGLVSLSDVVERLFARAEVGLVFLDACRENPAQATGLSPNSPTVRAPTSRERMAYPTAFDNSETDERPTSVLAKNPLSIFIAYSASPYSVAFDGYARLSPFTGALVKYLDPAASRGIPLERVMAHVRQVVGEATNWQQVPWTRSSLSVPVFLNGHRTLSEIRLDSKTRAREAMGLLQTGDRIGAIKAALGALPARTTSKDLQWLEEAHRVLYEAFRSRNVRLPLAESVSARYSANGNRVLTMGSLSNEIKLWNAEAGELMAELLPEHEDMRELGVPPKFSSGGEVLAFVTPDTGKLHIWDADSGRSIFAERTSLLNGRPAIAGSCQVNALDSGGSIYRNCGDVIVGVKARRPKALVSVDGSSAEGHALGNIVPVFVGFLSRAGTEEIRIPNLEIPWENSAVRLMAVVVPVPVYGMHPLWRESSWEAEQKYFRIEVFSFKAGTGGGASIGAAGEGVSGMFATDFWQVPLMRNNFSQFDNYVYEGATARSPATTGVAARGLMSLKKVRVRRDYQFRDDRFFSPDGTLVARRRRREDGHGGFSYQFSYYSRKGSAKSEVLLEEHEMPAQWCVFDLLGRERGCHLGTETWVSAPRGMLLVRQAREYLQSKGVTVSAGDALDLGW